MKESVTTLFTFSVTLAMDLPVTEEAVLALEEPILVLEVSLFALLRGGCVDLKANQEINRLRR